MNRFLLLTALLSLLAGCAITSKSPAVGSLTQKVPAAAHAKMAKDVVTKMSVLYPPARSKLLLRHATPDAFGSALVDGLRRKGYALSEFVSPANAGSTTPGANASNLSLSYVVDQPLDAGSIRVTVVINSQSLTRLYQLNEGSVAAAGYWVRKE